jgi:hypothetical protein
VAELGEIVRGRGADHAAAEHDRLHDRRSMADPPTKATLASRINRSACARASAGGWS